MNIPDNVKYNRITPIVSLRKFVKDFAQAVEEVFDTKQGTIQDLSTIRS